MIIGNGDIAKVLVDRKDVIYFASGVSNSKEDRESEYEREMDLLATMPNDMHLVYISTLAIYYADSRYVQHKKAMEDLVRRCWGSYTIFRIGNITWGTNPHTLLNYLREHPEAEIQNVYRYLIDKEEFLHWISMAPIPGRSEMNVTGRRVWVPDLVSALRFEAFDNGPKLSKEILEDFEKPERLEFLNILNNGINR